MNAENGVCPTALIMMEETLRSLIPPPARIDCAPFEGYLGFLISTLKVIVLVFVRIVFIEVPPSDFYEWAKNLLRWTTFDEWDASPSAFAFCMSNNSHYPFFTILFLHVVAIIRDWKK